MRDTKRKYVFIAATILFCALVAVYFIYGCRVENGTVRDLNSLPFSGDVFSGEKNFSAELTYTMDFGKTHLQGKGQVQKEEFLNFLKSAEIPVLWYGVGFPGSKIGGRAEFLPKTSNVAYATFSVPDSRKIVELMYEPNSNSSGTLFINSD